MAGNTSASVVNVINVPSDASPSLRAVLAIIDAVPRRPTHDLQLTWESGAGRRLPPVRVRPRERARPLDAQPYEWRFGNVAELVRHVHDDLAAGRPREEIAAAFHESIADGVATLCADVGGPRVVVLSGGSFQNVRLLASTRRRLERQGFRLLSHRLVPPNDGGISYGQAAIAAHADRA